MSADANLLYETFTLYYEKAKSAQNTGNVQLAKRYYFYAAETLMKLAKESSDTLRKTRMDRARRIIEIAENLKEVKMGEGNTTSKKVGISSKQEDEDDSLKKWQAAEIPNIHFSDIAGLDEVKKAVTTRMINPLKYPEKYAAYGKNTGGGVLLYGPPGTGKTMIAKAIACEVGATFFAVKGSDIVSKWVGDSEKNISLLFESARKEKLSIIFIDEMDSLIGTRGVDSHNDKRVNEFLQQIDGFVGRNPNMLLLGATNRPWDIDSAATRSGRFSQKIYVPLPDNKAREFLIKKFLSKAPIDNSINIGWLVEATDGYSGADIEELCDRAKEDPLMKAINSDTIIPLTKEDFMKALRSVRPSVSKKEIEIFDKYANIPVDINKEEKLTIEPKKSDEEVNITLKEETISLLPFQKPRIEFYLSKEYPSIYINLNTHNYVCSQNIKNWISDEINIDEAGTYEVIVYSEKEVCRFNITFVKGMQENDLDI